MTAARRFSLSAIEDFGRIDAESDLQLPDFFISTEAFRRVSDREHIIVVGRKGTGKTAIYKAILQQAAASDSMHATGLQFRNYPWQAHTEVENTSLALVERYVESWEFLIFVELAKLALLAPQSIPSDDQAHAAARGVTRFITTNWGQVQFSFKDTFSRRRYSVQLEPTFAGTALGSVQVDKVDSKQMAGFLVEANRWLRGCLNLILNAKHSYFILFDDVDRGYEPASPEYIHRLIGLLLAAGEVYNWAEDAALSVAPIVLLRSDISETLKFSARNKLYQNLVETLRWTDSMTGEESLKVVMDRRIEVAGDLTRGVQDPWATVFDAKNMPGTQHKFRHMAARTYLRPRDIVQFANYCLWQAQAAGAEMIENRHIARARADYSSYLLEELADETSEAVPGWDRLLEVLRRIHRLRFERPAFDTMYENMDLETELGVNAESALRTLVRFSGAWLLQNE